MEFLERMYGLLIKVASSLDSSFLLLVRLYWGVQMAQTGWGKLQSLDRVTSFFASLGIPAPAANAVFIAVLEFMGGILFAAGLGGRLIALLFVGDMVTAYLTADRDAFLSFFSAPDKFAAASPFVFLVAALIVLIAGPGNYSIDALLVRRFTRSPLKRKSPELIAEGR